MEQTSHWLNVGPLWTKCGLVIGTGAEYRCSRICRFIQRGGVKPCRPSVPFRAEPTVIALHTGKTKETTRERDKKRGEETEDVDSMCRNLFSSHKMRKMLPSDQVHLTTKSTQALQSWDVPPSTCLLPPVLSCCQDIHVFFFRGTNVRHVGVNAIERSRATYAEDGFLDGMNHLTFEHFHWWQGGKCSVPWSSLLPGSQGCTGWQAGEGVRGRALFI